MRYVYNTRGGSVGHLPGGEAGEVDETNPSILSALNAGVLKTLDGDWVPPTFVAPKPADPKPTDAAKFSDVLSRMRELESLLVHTRALEARVAALESLLSGLTEPDKEPAQ